MGNPATDRARGGAGMPLAQPGPTLLGVLSTLPPKFRWTVKSFFGYVTEFLTLAASGTATLAVNIQGDTDFILSYAEAVVTDSTNLIQLAFVPQLVQLQDAAAGINFFQSPEHFNSVYGDAQNPGIFPTPIILRAATSMNVTHQNLEATARNVRCAFNGLRSRPGTDTRDPNWQ